MAPSLTMSRILDLSIGTPERGAVNFNALHQLLGAMIKKLGLTDTVAEMEDPAPSTDNSDGLGIRKASLVPGAGKSTFSDLHDKVAKIERELHTMNAGELPAPLDIMSKVREEKPLTDLWQHIKQNKKVESNEAAIGKLMELTESLIKDNKALRAELDDLKKKIPEVDTKTIDARLDNLEKMAAKMDDLESAAAKMGELDDVISDVDKLRHTVSGLLYSGVPSPMGIPGIPGTAGIPGTPGTAGISGTPGISGLSGVINKADLDTLHTAIVATTAASLGTTASAPLVGGLTKGSSADLRAVGAPGNPVSANERAAHSSLALSSQKSGTHLGTTGYASAVPEGSRLLGTPVTYGAAGVSDKVTGQGLPTTTGVHAHDGMRSAYGHRGTYHHQQRPGAPALPDVSVHLSKPAMASATVEESSWAKSRDQAAIDLPRARSDGKAMPPVQRKSTGPGLSTKSCTPSPIQSGMGLRLTNLEAEMNSVRTDLATFATEITKQLASQLEDGGEQAPTARAAESAGSITLPVKRGNSDTTKKLETTLRKKNPQATQPQDALSGFPDPSTLVTWPGLEDALNGIRGEFSRMVPKVSIPASARSGGSIKPGSSGQLDAMKQTSSLPSVRAGQPSAATAHQTGGLQRHPSEDLQNVLQKIGTVDKRHEALVERVDELEAELKTKANADEVGAQVPDDLLETVDKLKEDVAALQEMRLKHDSQWKALNALIADLEALTADIPENNDPLLPIGDRSKIEKRNRSKAFALTPVEVERTIEEAMLADRYDVGAALERYGVAEFLRKDGASAGHVSVTEAYRPALTIPSGMPMPMPMSLAGSARSHPSQLTQLDEWVTNTGRKVIRKIDPRGRGTVVLEVCQNTETKESFATLRLDPRSGGGIRIEVKGESAEERANGHRTAIVEPTGQLTMTRWLSGEGRIEENIFPNGSVRAEHTGVAQQYSAEAAPVLWQARRGCDGLVVVDRRLGALSNGHSQHQKDVRRNNDKLNGGEVSVETRTPSGNVVMTEKRDGSGNVSCEWSDGPLAVMERLSATTGELTSEWRSTNGELVKVHRLEGSGSCCLEKRTSKGETITARYEPPTGARSKGMETGSEDGSVTVQRLLGNGTAIVYSEAKRGAANGGPVVVQRQTAGQLASAEARRKSPAQPTGEEREADANETEFYNVMVQEVASVRALLMNTFAKMKKWRDSLKHRNVRARRVLPCCSAATHSTDHDQVNPEIDEIYMDPISSAFLRTLREVIRHDYLREIERASNQLTNPSTHNTVPGRVVMDAGTATSGVDTGSRDSLLSSITVSSGPSAGGMGDAIARLAHEFGVAMGDLHRRMMDTEAAMTELVNEESDADSISRAQAAIMQLQGELEATQQLVDFLNSENTNRVKQLEDVGKDTARLDATKVDKHHLVSELDVKANKNSVDNKVERALFDNACTDLQKMITDLLSKLQAYEEAWRRAHDKIEEDVDGKLDRTEIDSLKKYLDKKMKELNAKMKQTSGLINPYCDDAAGLKKQLLPFNCLSCDKPVMATGTGLGAAPGMSGPPGTQEGFSPQRSARPYTTFELDQIRHHAKSYIPTVGMAAPISNKLNFARSLTEKSIAQLRKKDLNAYLVHFGKTLGPKVFITRSKQRLVTPTTPDWYSAPRQCGGKHTTVPAGSGSPVKGTSAKSFLKDLLIDEDFVAVGTLKRCDQRLPGADGRMYKGRDDTIQLDEGLTQAMHTASDPIVPLVTELQAGLNQVGMEMDSATGHGRNSSTLEESLLRQTGSQSPAGRMRRPRRYPLGPGAISGPKSVAGMKSGSASPSPVPPTPSPRTDTQGSKASLHLKASAENASGTKVVPGGERSLPRNTVSITSASKDQVRSDEVAVSDAASANPPTPTDTSRLTPHPPLYVLSSRGTSPSASPSPSRVESRGASVNEASWKDMEDVVANGQVRSLGDEPMEMESNSGEK